MIENDDIKNLENKIRAVRRAEKPAANPAQALKNENAENVSTGMRAGAELTGAIIGSGFIGWALDRWLDTAPLMLIVLLVAGVFTGFFNVYRLTQSTDNTGAFSGLRPPAKTAKNAPDKTESNKES